MQVEIQNLWKRINNVSGTLGKFNNQKNELSTSNTQLNEKNTQLSRNMEEINHKLQVLQSDYNNLLEKDKKLENVQGVNSELLSKIADYDNQIKKMTQQYEQSKARIEEMLSENTALKQNIEEINARLGKVDALEEEKNNLLEKIKELESKSVDFDYARLEIARKNKEIYDKNNTITTLKDRNSELESRMFELERLKQELAAADEREKFQNEKIQLFNTEIADLGTQLEISKKKIDEKSAELNTQIKLLQSDLAEARNVYHDLYESKRDVMNRQVGFIDDIARLKHQVEERDAAINALRVQTSDYATNEQKLNLDIDFLKSKINELTPLKTELEISRQAEIAKDGEIADLQAAKSELINKKDDLEFRNLELSEQVDTLESDKTALNTQIAELQALIDTQAKTIDTKSGEIADLNVKLENEVNINAELNEKNSGLYSEIAERQSKIDELNNKCFNGKVMTMQLLDEAKIRGEEIADWKQKFEDQRLEMLDLMTKLDEVKCTLQDANAEINLANTGRNALSGQNEELNSQISTLVAENEKILKDKSEADELLAMQEEFGKKQKEENKNLMARIVDFETLIATSESEKEKLNVKISEAVSEKEKSDA
ncbi:MAG: hypothetical protein PHV24_08215, partial [Candidatus Kapabacteria bacterium]|nr:hypothetical protein [Candidatus Kapabacteria bacterium]